MSSAVPTYLDALVAALSSAPGLQSPVQVFDGPVVTSTPPQQHVVVGYDGGETDGAVIDWLQEQATIDGQRDEAFTLIGCVVAWSGDTDNKARRDQVFTLLAAVEDVVRTGIDVGLPGPAVADFAPSLFRQEQANYGMQAKILFGVRYEGVSI